MYSGGSIWDDIKQEFRSGNALTRLILVNIGVFITLNLLHLVLFLSMGDRAQSQILFYEVLSWLMIPAEVGKLLTRPWTLITHMFAHYEFWHIRFNMLWLYWFGRILRDFAGNHRLFPIYFLGGIAGAFLLIISYNLFPVLQPALPHVRALGASAGVLAIITATATLMPNYTIYLLFLGPVKIKWIALVMVVIDLLSITGSNTGGHIAHIGGAIFGFVFIKQLQQGQDWSRPFNNFTDLLREAFVPGQKPRVVHRSDPGRSSKRRKKEGQKPKDTSKQERIDAILDKISRSGYDSLSKEEKDFLFKASREEDER